MKSSKKWVLYLLGLTLSIVLFACAPNDISNEEAGAFGESSSNTGGSSSLKTPKDALVFLSAENLTGQWDPTEHSNLAQNRIETFIFNKLFDSYGDEKVPQDLTPSLAESAEQIDANTLEIKLKKGIKFHNGQEFTAKDVAATYEYASQANKASFGNMPGKVTGEVVDDYTVRLITEEPTGALWFTTAYFQILSKEDIDNGNVGKKPNGTGPFKFDRQEGDKTILVKNEDYFQGAPKLNEFHFWYVPDSSTRVLQLQSGEADVIDRLEPEQAATLKNFKGTKVLSTVSPENKWLLFREIFRDEPLLRQAVAHAIDRDAIVDLLGDAGEATDNFIAPMHFGYEPYEWPYEYDPEKAKKLLAEAGYPNGEGLPTIQYDTSVGFYTKTKEYGEFIAAQLEAVGFDVQLTTLEAAAWNEVLYKPNHANLFDSGWMIGNPEPNLVIRQWFHSDSSRTLGLNNSKIDASIDKETRESDPEERMRILKEETIPLLHGEIPAIPLFRTVLLTGVREEVNNFNIYPTVSTVDILETEKTGY